MQDEDFPKEVAEVLARAGWFPGRQFNIDGYVRALEADGYTVFPRVREFLRSFGGLSLSWKVNISTENEVTQLEGDAQFDAAAATANLYPGTVQAYARVIHMPLCVIGASSRGHLTWAMSPGGQVFGGFDDSFGLLGETPEQAIIKGILTRKFASSYPINEVREKLSEPFLITRTHVANILRQWQEGYLSAEQVHEIASGLAVPGEVDFEDYESKKSATNEVLTLLDMLDVNLITPEDVPIMLEFLARPPEAFDEAYTRFQQQLELIDRDERMARWKNTQPYAAIYSR